MKYVTKDAGEQREDLQSLDILKRIDKAEYFEELQLLNKLVGVDTYEKVNEADRYFSSARSANLKIVEDNNDFDKQYFKDLHAYLFQDIYYFAGEIRDVPMEIDSVTKFISPLKLESALDRFFEKLKESNNLQCLEKKKFCSALANRLTDINIIHPFREGNGRTKRVFFEQLAKKAGYKLDWSVCSKDEWKMADECAFDSSRDGARDCSYLKLLLNRAVSTLEKKKENAPQGFSAQAKELFSNIPERRERTLNCNNFEKEK